MRGEKQLLLDEIKEQIDKYDSFVVMRYLGLSANAANDLRVEVAKTGGSVEVMRKRILIKAASSAGVEIDKSMLDGHIGLVFAGEDPIETTKLLIKFSKDNGEAVSLVGGRFDGQLYSAKEVEQLSKLPGKDQMRAELLGVLAAPMSQTVSAMNAVLISVVYCLDNKIKSSEN